VEWIGSSNSPNREFSDTSVSVATPAMVSCSAPPQSLAAFWQLASGNTALCTLVAPVGSIIDVSLSLILLDDDVSAPSVAVATGILSYIYYLALDGPSTNRYTPVSLTTTH